MSTLRSPWAHFEECPQALLYLNWRAYVEVVFPNRVCPLPPDRAPVGIPEYAGG